MSDVFGGTAIPLALSGASVTGDDKLGLADPTAHRVLGFSAAVMRAAAGDEWAALRPRPQSDTEGLNVVRRAYVANPAEAMVETDDLPSLFLWRPRAKQEQSTVDFRTETTGLQALWVLPYDEGRKATVRKPIINGVMKALSAAIRHGRHPAWYDAGIDGNAAFPADDDPRAPTKTADDDALVLPVATSTSSATLSGAGLTGVTGAAVMNPRRGLSVTTSAATGAYNAGSPIVVTYLDWLDQERTASFAISANGGQTVTHPTADAKQVVSVAIPAQQSTAGTIRVGLQARAGRGSSLLNRARIMRAELTEWATHTLPIDVLASARNVDNTIKLYGVLATIQIVEQLVRDPALQAWPIATPPAGLDLDVSIDGDVVTRAEL